MVVAAYRIGFTWNAIVPTEGTIHVRVMKSPKTLTNLRSLANGVEIIPGLPWSAAALLQETHRVLNIAFSLDGSVTVILDRALTAEEQSTFSGFGATVSVYDSETVISNTTETYFPEHSVLYGLYTTVFSSKDARITSGGGTFTATLSPTAITMRGFSALTAPIIDSTPSSDTLVFASFAPRELTEYIPQIFTQNTPGLSNFFTIASQNGLSAVIRHTTGTPQYTFATPITNETREFINESSLRALATELTEIPSINGITDFLDDGSKTIALRSREAATVVLRDESPYRFLTATSSVGSVTLTQTPTHLTVSNASSTALVPEIPSCLASASAFMKPSAIQALLPERTFYTSQTLASLLWRAHTIASSTTITRICIVD